MRVAIVGAGMAGLSCAQVLVAAGVEVSLYDKGRGAGGRMASRRLTTSLGPTRFDHGAQFMTVRDPGFRAQIDTWSKSGVVGLWPAAGEDAWVGVPAMNAPLRAMAHPLNVRWNAHVEGLVRDGDQWTLRGPELDAPGFDWVVSALPAEQTGRLLGALSSSITQIASQTRSAPCWTAMAAFAHRLDYAPDVFKSSGPVGWAARNCAKPGRFGPEAWVVQGSPDWSREHLEQDAPGAALDLLAAFFEATGLAPTTCILLTGHRWRYARSGSAHRDVLCDAHLRIGACGDWLAGPRVENAWISGRALASRLII